MIKLIKKLLSKLAINKSISCKFLYTNNKSYYNIVKYFKNIINDNTVIVCVGTPQGNCKDILGPLIGQALKDNFNFTLPVYGTINDPIQFSNASEKIAYIKNIHKNATIITVDTCIGKKLGEISIENAPIIPGGAIDSERPSIGDYSILCVVSNNLASIYEKQNDMVKDVANIITRGIELAYMIYKSKTASSYKSSFNELKDVKYLIDNDCNITISLNGEIIKFNQADLKKMNDDLTLFGLAKADGI